MWLQRYTFYYNIYKKIWLNKVNVCANICDLIYFV